MAQRRPLSKSNLRRAYAFKLCTKQIKYFILHHFYYTSCVQIKSITNNLGKSNNNYKDNKVVSIRADIMGKVEVCIIRNNNRFIILVIIISTLISAMTANVHRDAFGLLKIVYRPQNNSITH